MKYNAEKKHWTVEYHWIVDPYKLPNKYAATNSRLKSVERSLEKDATWAAAYSKQIDDMIERKVARKLDKEEIVKWKEPTFYISHLAVISPKSASTPIRIVFNSSELHQGISLNNCLAKGPDTYANNILGLLLRWRKDKVAMVGDIKKITVFSNF